MLSFVLAAPFAGPEGILRLLVIRDRRATRIIKELITGHRAKAESIMVSESLTSVDQNAMKIRQKMRKGLILFSFLLFPGVFYYMSPYLIIEATLKGVINGSFIMFSLMFLSSLVLGRGFCGGYVLQQAVRKQYLLPEARE